MGKRLGAAKRHASPKHRPAVCKALLRERFLELCAALLRAGRLPAGIELGALQRCTYREAKRTAAAYQQRKRALLASAPFSEWIGAPAACEDFG